MSEQIGDYEPHHCPTCHCNPVGALPPDVPVDPYCPEHGSKPTAYDDCSCFRRLPPAATTTPPTREEARSGLGQEGTS